PHRGRRTGATEPGGPHPTVSVPNRPMSARRRPRWLTPVPTGHRPRCLLAVCSCSSALLRVRWRGGAVVGPAEAPRFVTGLPDAILGDIVPADDLTAPLGIMCQRSELDVEVPSGTGVMKLGVVDCLVDGRLRVNGARLHLLALAGS